MAYPGPRHSRALCLLLVFFSTLASVVANVEKVIFQGPTPVALAASQPPSPSEQSLVSLSPQSNSIRTLLKRVFPAKPHDASSGHVTWFLLDGLEEGRRYELRVCWAAIEPTSFALHVLGLHSDGESTQATDGTRPEQGNSAHLTGIPPGLEFRLPQHLRQHPVSALLLQIAAAADYFSDNATLMSGPEPVLVDLILDPYFLNVVPRSLVPTVGYILIVALATWFAARQVASALQEVAGVEHDEGKKHD